MHLIGLTGKAGSGKDTAADYLVATHNFTKMAFADPLYEEVAGAFNVSVEWMKSRDTKEVPSPLLTASKCDDTGFFDYLIQFCESEGFDPDVTTFSPRWILQRWGTEYRRAQDDMYWLSKALARVDAWLELVSAWSDLPHNTTVLPAPPIGIVFTDIRRENERQFIDAMGGRVWHIHREIPAFLECKSQHVSEDGVSVKLTDQHIDNSGDVAQFRTLVSLALQDPGVREEVSFVRCDACGTPHIPYSFDQVVEEIEMFYQHWDGEGQRVKITPQDYLGCTNCGERAFTAMTPDEVRQFVETNGEETETGEIYLADSGPQPVLIGWEYHPNEPTA